MKKEFSGICDWCGKDTETLALHKDIDEGFAGQTYDVCRECREEESRRISQELLGAPDFDYE